MVLSGGGGALFLDGHGPFISQMRDAVLGQGTTSSWFGFVSHLLLRPLTTQPPFRPILWSMDSAPSVQVVSTRNFSLLSLLSIFGPLSVSVPLSLAVDALSSLSFCSFFSSVALSFIFSFLLRCVVRVCFSPTWEVRQRSSSPVHALF